MVTHSTIQMIRDYLQAAGIRLQKKLYKINIETIEVEIAPTVLTHFIEHNARKDRLERLLDSSVNILRLTDKPCAFH